MPIYTINLSGHEQIARDTHVFHFTKPKDFDFKPGQYGGFTLINPPEKDARGITRRFTFLSAPDDPEIAIASRFRPDASAFKKILMQLKIGELVKLAGPSGNFTLHEDAQIPAVFLAGGIGITPFYSMLRFNQAHRIARPIFLFYGNQDQEDAAFLNELHALQKTLNDFQLIPTLKIAPPSWEGERGFITKDMIKRYVPDVSKPIFYVCGAPTMVTVYQELLLEMGVASSQIKVEDFTGY